MPKSPPHTATQPIGPKNAPTRKSGRVQFDDRGQAVWEWAVQTGMFDRNATSQRVRTLSEPAMKLELEDIPEPADTAPTQAKVPHRGDAVTPYDRAPAKPAAAARPAMPKPTRESAGSDPYSRGPAKRPESMSFNPYERVPPRGR